MEAVQSDLEEKGMASDKEQKKEEKKSENPAMNVHSPKLSTQKEFSYAEGNKEEKKK